MFVVLELQRSNENSLSCLSWTFEDKNTAEQKYHQILAAAAVSKIDIHSAIILDEMGRRIKGEYYDHRIIQDQEEEIIIEE